MAASRDCERQTAMRQRGIALRQHRAARFLALGRKRASAGAQLWSVWAPAVVKRSIDVVFAFIAAMATLPLVLMLAVICRSFGGRAFRWTPVLGRHGKAFYRCYLAMPHSFTATGGVDGGAPGSAPNRPIADAWVWHGLAALPTVWHVLRGDMSWVGPRPLTVGGERPVGFMRRNSDRPGVIFLWWIRQQANIDYDSELLADREYTESRTTWTDWAMVMRAAWVAGLNRIQWFSSTPPCSPLDVLGVPVRNVSMDDAVTELTTALESDGAAMQATFVNADCINLAQAHADYRACLQKTDWNYPDGIGMKLAAQLQNAAIRQNVNGTDLFPRLLARMEESRLGVYLLGGEEGVADEVATWIRREHPGVVVCGTHHGYSDPQAQAALVEAINHSGADLLLVAMGAPRQELWIEECLPRLNVRVALGVGGLFDFYSGRRPRAPQWVRELGMEWAFRWWLEPRRLCRRYLIGNFLFMCRVFKHAIVRARD